MTATYLVSSECVRMCRQLTMIAESLPVRHIYCKYRFKEKRHTPKGNLTKERNPVSDKSCHLTEQAGKEE